MLMHYICSTGSCIYIHTHTFFGNGNSLQLIGAREITSHVQTIMNNNLYLLLNLSNIK